MQAAFVPVLQQLKESCKDTDFTALRELCFSNMEQILSLKFKNEMQKTNTSDHLIDLMNDRGYCTCLELRHISTIAKNSKVPEIAEIIEQFKNRQHKQKVYELNELHLNLQNQFSDDYVLVDVKLNLECQNTSIEDLTDCCKKLEKVANLPAGSYTLQSFKVDKIDKGIKITFIISSDCYSKAYIRTKDNCIELRPLHIRYIQFKHSYSEKIFAYQLTMTKGSSQMLEQVSGSCVACMLIL